MKRFRPEARFVWDPDAFMTSLPESVRELLTEAKACGLDVEILSEHRKVGEFELRIRIMPSGAPRELDLPPMVVGRKGYAG